MIDFFGTVEGEAEQLQPQMPADDAQAAEEVSAEELIANLTGENGGQTAENEGDSGQTEQTPQVQENNQKQVENDKFSRRISAALKSQKEQIYRELGMSEAEVRELIRAHKAEQMHKEDPEISPKAARQILEAREASAKTQEDLRVAQMKADLNTLAEDGWTGEMLQAFTTDPAVIDEIDSGKTVRQAAMQYLRRSQTQQTTRKAVPTVRTATSSAPPDEDRIASMSDKEFDELVKRARDAAYSGMKVTFR